MTKPSLFHAISVGLLLSLAAVIGQQGIIVKDGDTVRWAFVNWRLVGFDAPEVRQARCPRERQLGQEATVRLKALVASQPTRLVPMLRLGKFGRPLARLLIDREDVAVIAQREGWGRPYHGRGKRRGWCERSLKPPR